mmetsp:Transcript_46216/g.119106  ORF Transcript_46216/g.119106 Transcript_46216/m.119106 type:complete len:107 (+) Transcript_46216:912-1232(+)
MMLAYAEREEERSQIASIMTSILGLSAEEQKRLEGRRGSWLERIGSWIGPQQPSIREGQSMADAWVDFLLREAGEESSVDMAQAGATLAEEAITRSKSRGELKPNE